MLTVPGRGAAQLDPRWAPAMYVKSFLILATVAVSFYAAFFYFTNPLVGLPPAPLDPDRLPSVSHLYPSCTLPLWRHPHLTPPPGMSQTCLVCAVVNGIAMAEVGVSIQHDANHGAYASSPAICHLMGLTLDVFGGASSFMWKQQHVVRAPLRPALTAPLLPCHLIDADDAALISAQVGHHAFTNLHDNDPDIRVSKKDVRRVTSFQPWHGYQVGCAFMSNLHPACRHIRTTIRA